MSHLKKGDKVKVAFNKPAFFDPKSGIIHTGKTKINSAWKKITSITGVFEGKNPKAKEDTVHVKTTDLPYHHQSTSEREITFPLPLRLVTVSIA